MMTGIDQAAVAKFIAGVPANATSEQIRQVLVRMTQVVNGGQKLPGGVNKETGLEVVRLLQARLG